MNQRAEYVRHHTEDMTFSEVEVGEDSKTGLAVRVRFEDELIWVPYSQVKKIERDPKVKGQDKITVTAWWANKAGLAE